MAVTPREVLTKLQSDVAHAVAAWEKSFAEGDARFQKSKAKEGKFLGPSRQSLIDMTFSQGEINRELKNLKMLEIELKNLAPRLDSDPEVAISEIRLVMITNYIREYAEGRQDKKISPMLQELQNIILKATDDPADNFLMKNEHLSIKKGKGHEHFDARFLAMQFEIVDPELPKVVEFIFKNVLTTYAKTDTNLNLYTNYMKAIVRVGLSVAPSEWNKLVEQHLGNSKGNPFQITVEDVINAETRFNEEGIAKSYGKIMGVDEVLRKKVIDFLSPARTPEAEAKGSPSQSPRLSSNFPYSAVQHKETESERPSTAPADNPPPLLSSHRPKSS
jgi:hypothetical protein